MKTTFSKEIEKGILSGGLSQFALETGKKRVSYDDLADIKRRLKKMFLDDDAKNEILESKEYDDHDESIPISFAISDHKVFDNLRKNANVNEKKNIKEILYAHLTQHAANFGTSDMRDIAEKIVKENYKIDERYIHWMVDDSDSNIMKKFEDIKKCERNREKYPTPDGIKNSDRLWIIMDLRDAKGEMRCFALYS
eukprot:UN05670